MKPLVIIISVLFAALLLSSIVQQVRPPSGLDYARENAEIARLEREQASEAVWAPVRAAAVNIAFVAAVIIAPLLASAWGSLALIRFRYERIPNRAGLLPVRAELLDAVAPAALGAFHQTQLAHANVQPVPHSLSVHWAPHNAPRLDYRRELGGDVVSAPDEPAAVTHLPGLTDLADIGFVPSAERILLGLGAAGEQITVPMKSLWHVALAGPTGNGKSNIARMVVAQLQAIGAKVCVGDPKWTEYDADQDEDWRPIARRLYREPAHSAKGISALLKWATGELEHRLGLRRDGVKSGGPIFLYLDELPWIAAHVPNADVMIGELVRVGRGVGMFLLVGAQDMLAKTINLSAERDNFRTGFYLGGDDTTGAILLGIPKREVRDPDGIGLAWLRSTATTPPQQVRVPYASNRALVRLLGDGSADLVDLSPTSRPTSPQEPRSEREVGDEVKKEAGASGILTPSVRDQHILSLVKQKKGVSEIIAEVWGVKGGSKFSEYSAEVMAVIAQAIEAN